MLPLKADLKIFFFGGIWHHPVYSGSFLNSEFSIRSTVAPQQGGPTVGSIPEWSLHFLPSYRFEKIPDQNKSIRSHKIPTLGYGIYLLKLIHK